MKIPIKSAGAGMLLALVLSITIIEFTRFSSRTEIVEHKFQTGDIVETRLDMRRGIVITSHTYRKKYMVRFPMDDRGFGPPKYVLIGMEECELQKAGY